MRAIRILVVLTLVCLVFPGMQCKKWRNRQIHKMNITDAKALMIGPPPPSTTTKPNTPPTQAEEPVVQKILEGDNGSYLELVKFYDINGKLIKQPPTPTILQPAGKNFIVICFETQLYWSESSRQNEPVGGLTYLVRISDGAVFLIGGSLDDSPNFSGDSYAPAGDIQTDTPGNLYYVTSNAMLTSGAGEREGLVNSGLHFIVKIDVTDPDNVTRQIITPETDAPTSFIVDSNGTVVFAGGSTGIRIRKPGGGFDNAPSKYTGYYFKAPDGLIYFDREEGCDNESTFDRLTIDSTNTAVFTPDGMPLPIDLGYCPHPEHWAATGQSLFPAGGYLFYMPTFSIEPQLFDPQTLLKFDYTKHEIRELPLPKQLNAYWMLTVTDDFVFVRGGNYAAIDNITYAYVKVNVATDALTTIPQPAGWSSIFVDWVVVTENFLYLKVIKDAGEIALAKLHLATDVFTEVDTTGYDLLTLEVGSNDTVNFTALRLSDGVRVFGEIDKNGKVKILTEGLASAEIELIQIQ